MSDIYITAPNLNAWNRPGGWVEIPSISALDTKFYGVYAVYENRKNNVYIGFAAGTFNCTINWGDGSSNTIVSSVSTQTQSYTYASLTSPILQDEYGQNYKTVLITITQNSGAVTRFNMGSTTSIGTHNFLDIVMSWSTAAVQFLKGHPLLQRFIQYTGSWASFNVNAYMQNVPRCRVFQLPVSLGSPTQAASVFTYLGDCEIGDITIGGAISISSLFSTTLIRKVGNVDISAATIVISVFANCFNLKELGNVNLAAGTSFNSTFANCVNLYKIGTITSTAVTNLTSAFSGCVSLRTIILTDLTNVTITTGAFSNCFSLQNLRVPNIVQTFTVADCAMERAALVQVFNDLGTPGTTRTITVTRNPGSADLTAADILIATNKNWTVTL
jgi:hypothetical protein